MLTIFIRNHLNEEISGHSRRKLVLVTNYNSAPSHDPQHMAKPVVSFCLHPLIVHYVLL